MDTPLKLFQQYVTEVGGRAAAAERLHIGVGQIGHILCGRRGISQDVARAIDSDTNGIISKAALRPDVWGEDNNT